MEMSLEYILLFNDLMLDKIKGLKEEISEIESEISVCKSSITAPCKFCPYDGEYRCETCAENCYAGFNVKDYTWIGCQNE